MIQTAVKKWLRLSAIGCASALSWWVFPLLQTLLSTETAKSQVCALLVGIPMARKPRARPTALLRSSFKSAGLIKGGRRFRPQPLGNPPNGLRARQLRIAGVVPLHAMVILLTNSMSLKVALAQSTCTPPETGEYLLLIVSDTEAEQDLARRTLPSDVESEVCRYVEDVVTRVGGFEDQLIAEDWATYIKDNSGLRTYVVKPNTVSQRPPNRRAANRSPASELNTEPRSIDSPRERQQPQPRSRTQPSTEETSFNPRRLGSGYAVLVDYLNQPELATEIAEITGVEVGLASYGQRPYLLVTQTNNIQAATSTLQSLSRRGFFVLMVESRRVILISPSVNP